MRRNAKHHFVWREDHVTERGVERNEFSSRTLVIGRRKHQSAAFTMLGGQRWWRREVLVSGLTLGAAWRSDELSGALAELAFNVRVVAHSGWQQARANRARSNALRHFEAKRNNQNQIKIEQKINKE